MRLLAFLTVALLTAPAAADRTREPPPRSKPAETARSAPCKRVVVGRGLERKVVCELTAPIVVQQAAPRPNVVMVIRDGRSIVGRPKSRDPLEGLSRRRETAN